MSNARKTDSQYTTGMIATMGGNGRTVGFNRSTNKTLAILPMGVTIEIYRRPDGTTQCDWFPKRPDFQHSTVRESVFPHYATAMQAYADQFGAPGHVHGSAYEGGQR